MSKRGVIKLREGLLLMCSKKTKQLQKHFLFFFPALYVYFAMCFLNQVYKSGCLFPIETSLEQTTCSIYFVSDIFDVFWLIIAAIPNMFFARSYYQEMSCSVFKEIKIKVGSYDTKTFFWVGWFLLSCLIFVLVVWPSTISFSQHECAWSNKISFSAKAMYSCFGALGIGTIVMESICIIIFIYYSMKITPSCNLSLRSLMASIILFAYWIMLILSNISNMRLSNGSISSPDIISNTYCVLGATIILAITACAYFWHKASSDPKRRKDDLQFILGSIVIPFIPIVIQLFQIIL